MLVEELEKEASSITIGDISNLIDSTEHLISVEFMKRNEQDNEEREEQ